MVTICCPKVTELDRFTSVIIIHSKFTFFHVVGTCAADNGSEDMEEDRSSPIEYETSCCDELSLEYPFKDWETMDEAQRDIAFNKLERDAEKVSEAFTELITEIFKSFRNQGVDVDELKIFIIVFCTKLTEANPEWLKSLKASTTMTNIFSFIGEHSLWLCPDLLEAIVKKFGNESDREKLREYQDHSLEPYLRKSI